jgi:Molecular chaperone (small heat shock protein)
MELTECRETEGLSRYRRDMSVFDRYYGWPFFDNDCISFTPPLELVENEDDFRVFVELPGVDEKDVKTTWVNGQLVIKGEKKSSAAREEDLCCCSERNFGSFERVLPICSAIDSDHMTAHFTRGVLEVILPKKEEAKPKIVKIE